MLHSSCAQYGSQSGPTAEPKPRRAFEPGNVRTHTCDASSFRAARTGYAFSARHHDACDASSAALSRALRNTTLREGARGRASSHRARCFTRRHPSRCRTSRACKWRLGDGGRASSNGGSQRAGVTQAISSVDAGRDSVPGAALFRGHRSPRARCTLGDQRQTALSCASRARTDGQR